MNGVMLVLIVAAIGITVFPQIYWTGWAISVLPMYFVLFKQATIKAAESSERTLLTGFKKEETETVTFYLFRRTLGALGWLFGTVLVYWVILPYAFLNKDLVINNLAKGLASE